MERRLISYWDALIVAAALLAGCDTHHTEDLEHGRTFDGQLTVVNPCVAACFQWHTDR